MKAILSIIVLSFSMQVFAAKAPVNPCENHAKAAAIRLYKAVNTGIQGSYGIEYWSEKKSSRGDVHSYLVTVMDNNDEGEAWEVDYAVRIKEQADKTCKVLSVKEVTVRDISGGDEE